MTTAAEVRKPAKKMQPGMKVARVLGYHDIPAFTASGVSVFETHVNLLTPAGDVHCVWPTDIVMVAP